MIVEVSDKRASFTLAALFTTSLTRFGFNFPLSRLVVHSARGFCHKHNAARIGSQILREPKQFHKRQLVRTWLIVLGTRLPRPV